MIENEALTQDELKEDTLMKRVIFTILAIAIVKSACGELVESAFAKYSGGTGDPNTPYQIATKDDLLALATDTNDYNKCFILTADINMGGQVFTKAIIAPSTSSNSNFQGTAFSGTFDGKGHKIMHFTINNPAYGYYLGLFGYINFGSVKNLGLENCSFIGLDYVGGLVGLMDYGSISNCYSTGSVSGTDYVGGLVGFMDYGSISNCYSTGSVSGSSGYDCAGGLVGRIWCGSISNCYSTGSVSGTDDVGGLVGENSNGSISNCYSTGSVTGASGLYYYYVGGLVGQNYGYGAVSNCYSTGSVSGTDDVGGLVGSNDGSISNCYSTGSVSGTDDVGGLVGSNDGSIAGSYFLDTSGPDNEYGEPLTDEQMKQQSNFVGWDFVNETINGPNDIWTINETIDYPKLVWPMVNLVSSMFPFGWYEVDFVDFSVLANWWGRTDCATNNDCDGADFDFSGTEDIADLKIFCNYWLQGL